MTSVPPKRSAVCVDLDGTIVDVSHLWHLAYGPEKDYEEFHRHAANAEPLDDTLIAVDRAASVPWIDVIIVTARQEKYREVTTEWLRDIGELKYTEMWMRKDGDERSDYEVKKEILVALQKTYRIEQAFDDNPNTVKLWLENGIMTTVVPGWPEEERWASAEHRS